MSMDAPEYPCPACGFLAFDEPPGSYGICGVCGWEDDHVQLAQPRLRGGANRESLVEAQQRALQLHPLPVQRAGDVQRDPGWRPLSEAEAGAAESSVCSGEDYFAAAAADSPRYYWRKP